MSSLFPTYARWEIAVEEANGSTIIDKNGKEYLDFISGIAVCNLGHCHPKVTTAVQEQLKKVWHVSNLFEIEGQERVAALLTEHSSGDYVFFCNSGAEANEAAIKLARKYTGKHKIISFQQSFHGRTFGSMAATGQEKIHQGFGPMLAGFEYLPYNDLATFEETIHEDVAAVMVEVIQGEGGVNPGQVDFIQGISSLCKQKGILLIVDEVQTGIGRTGETFAYKHYGIDPDMITVAKGLGNGFPVGALIGKEFLKESFGPGSHGSTFGGNPLAMAAAEATLTEVFSDECLQQVKELGDYLLTKLKEELSDCLEVEDVRGKGLMVGIACKEDVGVKVKRLREKGLLVLVAGPKVIRLLPAFTVKKEQIDEAVALIVSECRN
ncbi:acetylornithine transaminase [Desertibacillus haloalkaliphilus]|uniref:acetylornithine transaminase n=1 Tax=Desertibacillus haloalkaliphilus TaxID=1328930 RepID=UPI001C26DD89|nr:acetylornithine transaminase [Desertibacillus haloalkaliphilus]MBU8908342.1 acetylornithine transaminase [Desertibacillus haloalkaliphilus]